MRTTILFSLLLVTAAVFAQTPETPPPAAVPAPAAPPAAAEPQGFGDLKFGESMDRLKEVFGPMKCKKGRKEKDGRLNEWCELPSFKLGEHDTKVAFDFKGGKFIKARVIFSSDLVDEMRDLLVAKYGPTSKVDVVTERESTWADAMTPNEPTRVFEWTYTKWEWPNARVELVDQRKHVDFHDVSRFEVIWVSPEEKAEKEKALKAF